ncbi:M24 family metallopeptidase [Thalassobaculum sp.]|uniref:M24 family metallopeptidase n=1 Tax=Thalassobaculum sp. TaxID=2022740 RepID=UPI0032EF8B6B
MKPAFAKAEYQARVTAAKSRMVAAGIDVLVVTEPSNMGWLTGYDGWSFYTPQCLLVAQTLDEPVLIVRGMDANAGKVTTYLDHGNILGYPDHYVQQPDRHPMDWVAEEMARRGIAAGSIGLEMDSYYFSPMAYEHLKAALPNCRIANANNLVNWCRSIKSPAEIAYIREAARIVEHTMAVGIEHVTAGTRQCDAVAAIYDAQIRGAGGTGGDYPAIVPMLPTGIGASTPHLTWSDDVFKTGEATILELAGTRRRYHCPMARTVSLGRPPQKLADASAVICDGIAAALEAAKPGATCEEVEQAWRRELAKSGFIKDSRIGYSVGLNYPPDWGEHTMSLRAGDRTVIQPNMTFHMIPGLMLDDCGIEISECFLITETGSECFCDFPRPLVIKD